MSLRTIVLEDSVALTSVVNPKYTLNSAISFMEKLLLKLLTRRQQENVYSDSVCNSKALEPFQMPINIWMEE